MGLQALQTQPVSSTFENFMSDVRTVALRSDGFKIITELAIATLDFLKFVLASVPSAILYLGRVLVHTKGVLTIMSMVKHLTNFTTRDSEGKLFYQRGKFESVRTTTMFSSLAVFSSTSFVRFLHDVKVISLGAAATPLSYISSISLGVVSVCDIIGQSKFLHELPATRRAVEQKKHQFQALREPNQCNAYANTRIQNIGRQIAALNQAAVVAQGDGRVHAAVAQIERKVAAANPRAVANNPHAEKLEQLTLKQRKWELLRHTTDQAQKKELWQKFCDHKIAKEDAKLDNLGNNQKRAWASIAFSVSVFALVVLAFVLPAILPVAITASLLILNIASSVFELSGFILDFCLKDKEVKHAKLPESVWMLPQLPPPPAVAAAAPAFALAAVPVAAPVALPAAAPAPAVAAGV